MLGPPRTTALRHITTHGASLNRILEERERERGKDCVYGTTHIEGVSQVQPTHKTSLVITTYPPRYLLKFYNIYNQYNLIYKRIISYIIKLSKYPEILCEDKNCRGIGKEIFHRSCLYVFQELVFIISSFFKFSQSQNLILLQSTRRANSSNISRCFCETRCVFRSSKRGKHTFVQLQCQY